MQFSAGANYFVLCKRLHVNRHMTGAVISQPFQCKFFFSFFLYSPLQYNKDCCDVIHGKLLKDGSINIHLKDLPCGHDLVVDGGSNEYLIIRITILNGCRFILCTKDETAFGYTNILCLPSFNHPSSSQSTTTSDSVDYRASEYPNSPLQLTIGINSL